MRHCKGRQYYISDKIEIYLKSKTGTLHNGYILYKQRNYHLHAGNIEKTGEQSFFLDRATVTTCDSEPPEWHISGREIEAVRHENISGWSGKFHIKNVPVLYTPYFMIPLIKERQTGFLFPSYGYSSIRGHYYKQGFFWALIYNILLLPIAAGVLYPYIHLRPEWAALAMALSSVSVVTNALFLQRFNPIPVSNKTYPIESKQLSKSKTAIDPICKMTVDTTTALHSDFKGQRYFFCSSHCKITFDANPARYVHQDILNGKQ